MNKTNLSILLFQGNGQEDEKCIKIFHYHKNSNRDIYLEGNKIET